MCLGGQQIDTVKKRRCLFLVHSVEHMVAAALRTCSPCRQVLLQTGKGAFFVPFIEVYYKMRRLPNIALSRYRLTRRVFAPSGRLSPADRFLSPVLPVHRSFCNSVAFSHPHRQTAFWVFQSVGQSMRLSSHSSHPQFLGLTAHRKAVVITRCRRNCLIGIFHTENHLIL